MTEGPSPQALAAGLLAACEGDRTLAILLLAQAKVILEDARMLNAEDGQIR